MALWRTKAIFGHSASVLERDIVTNVYFNDLLPSCCFCYSLAGNQSTAVEVVMRQDEDVLCRGILPNCCGLTQFKQALTAGSNAT